MLDTTMLGGRGRWSGEPEVLFKFKPRRPVVLPRSLHLDFPSLKEWKPISQNELGLPQGKKKFFEIKDTIAARGTCRCRHADALFRDVCSRARAGQGYSNCSLRKCVRQCGSVVRALGQQGARVTPHPAGWVSARPRQKNAIETRARVPLASD